MGDRNPLSPRVRPVFNAVGKENVPPNLQVDESIVVKEGDHRHYGVPVPIDIFAFLRDITAKQDKQAEDIQNLMGLSTQQAEEIQNLTSRSTQQMEEIQILTEESELRETQIQNLEHRLRDSERSTMVMRRHIYEANTVTNRQLQITNGQQADTNRQLRYRLRGVERQLVDFNAMFTCTICYDNPRDTFLPCGHFACSQCVIQSQNRCPYYRRLHHGPIRAYYC
jgi:hypothetical protein